MNAGRHNGIYRRLWLCLLVFISCFMTVFTVELAKKFEALWRCAYQMLCTVTFKFKTAQHKYGFRRLLLTQLYSETAGLCVSCLILVFKGTCVWRNYRSYCKEKWEGGEVALMMEHHQYARCEQLQAWSSGWLFLCCCVVGVTRWKQKNLGMKNIDCRRRKQSLHREGFLLLWGFVGSLLRWRG